ncbi:helix-turn-helix domain-containing protein [Tropicibacter sp. R16_0]|uniref:helix-turn-helix domain-containing protein n=1 Tax=Tropicibacter sp. R16_0 TaxID=2821102 RepID=UPI001ADC57E3|nr:helix-turn-helix transcriptional regulator [Tropicibacter sp. R16_0]MBO9453242.1 helix-turn-helix domain-containing protein [Tropicibacter sp. R16_0]
MEKQTAGTKLKALREEAGISIRKMAEALEMPSPSTYTHYENRYKKDFLPYDLILKLEPILNECGIESSRVLALGVGSDTAQGESMPGFGESRTPRIDVSVLLDEPEKPQNSPEDAKGTIKLAIVGDTIQLAATVDKDGIDELIRRINLARQMIE